MSLAPDPQEMALASALREIDLALLSLAGWCPHGGDSARVGDYYSARRARELLKEARMILTLDEQEPR